MLNKEYLVSWLEMLIEKRIDATKKDEHEIIATLDKQIAILEKYINECGEDVNSSRI